MAIATQIVPETTDAVTEAEARKPEHPTPPRHVQPLIDWLRQYHGEPTMNVLLGERHLGWSLTVVKAHAGLCHESESVAGVVVLEDGRFVAHVGGVSEVFEFYWLCIDWLEGLDGLKDMKDAERSVVGHLSKAAGLQAVRWMTELLEAHTHEFLSVLPGDGPRDHSLFWSALWTKLGEAEELRGYQNPHNGWTLGEAATGRGEDEYVVDVALTSEAAWKCRFETLDARLCWDQTTELTAFTPERLYWEACSFLDAVVTNAKLELLEPAFRSAWAKAVEKVPGLAGLEDWRPGEGES